MPGRDHQASPTALSIQQLELLPTACVGIDRDGCVTFWNAAAAREFGLAADQALGRPAAELISVSGDRHMLEQDLAALRGGEGVRPRTLRTMSPAGRPVQHVWTLLACHAEDGSFNGVMGLCQSQAVVSDGRADAPASEPPASEPADAPLDARPALEALHASETRNRALLDAIPDSLYVCDRQGRILDVRPPRDNRPMMPGITAGTRIRDVLEPDRAAIMLKVVDEVLATGTPRAFEYAIPTLDGPVCREARIVPFGADTVLALVRDVDAHRRSEEERDRLVSSLEAERRRLAAVLRQMPAMMMVYNAAGHISHVNDRWAEIIGVPADSIVGRHYSELPHMLTDASSRPLDVSDYPSVRALSGEDVDVEVGVPRPGGLLWFHVLASPIRTEDGAIDGAILTMRDLTAERAAAEALRTSEARNRALLDAIPDSLYRIDDRGIVLERRAPEDDRARLHDVYVGRDLVELFGEDLGGRLWRAVREALRTGSLRTVEYVRPGADGDLHREARIVSIGPDQALALVRDIGERIRADREREAFLQTIDRERRRLDAILRQAPNGLVVYDTQGRIAELNDVLVNRIGRPKSEILGRTAYEVGLRYVYEDGSPISPDELPSARALLGEETTCVLRGGMADHMLWIQASAAPIRDEHGTITGVIVASRNITAEREATEALRASEERNRALLAAIPDTIYVGGRDGIILDFKPPGDGRPLPDGPFIGRRVDDFWPTELASLVMEVVNRTLDTGQVQTVEFQAPSVDQGGYREARMVPYGSDRILALVRDVDARKRAEQALRALNQELEERVHSRTAELQAANLELEAFSYSVSHDLKAPLRGIDGYSRLLWEDYRDRLDDDGRVLLQNVRAGAAQMYQLIDDLLAYSRLERRAIDQFQIELLPIVEGLLDERADEIRARGVQVHVDVPEISVRADRDGLAQAVRNLLENALRFTADAARPQIAIGATYTPETCTLWVRDNGIGFEMAYHDRIFEIFQRLHRAEEYPGTGIGLALVRKAMQRMGGRVWAESSPGDGATFFLELPR